MGKGSESTQLASESKSDCNDSKLFTWNQVKNHNKKEDLWIKMKTKIGENKERETETHCYQFPVYPQPKNS
jgi:hypothetical protein